eukprot:1153641-Pelagomonas_calceolata.AAC.7
MSPSVPFLGLFADLLWLRFALALVLFPDLSHSRPALGSLVSFACLPACLLPWLSLSPAVLSGWPHRPVLDL